MPTERTVICPHCGAERTTKAHRSTNISCWSCGELFAAPEPPAGELVPSSAIPSTSADERARAEVRPPAPAPAPGKVRVVDAKGTRVAQTARPRARGKSGRFAAGEPADAPTAPPAPLGRHEHPQTAAAKISGRRGGAARYLGKVRRG
jgi:hypothetical protein